MMARSSQRGTLANLQIGDRVAAHAAALILWPVDLLLPESAKSRVKRTAKTIGRNALRSDCGRNHAAMNGVASATYSLPSTANFPFT